MQLSKDELLQCKYGEQSLGRQHPCYSRVTWGLKHQCCGRGDRRIAGAFLPPPVLLQVQQETLDQGNKTETQKGLLTNILH